MSFKSIIKSLIPHLSAIIIFLIIGFAFFQPILDGKQLRKGDTLNALGYKKEIMDFRKSTGEDPLWTNSMFGGMPAYQITVEYKSQFMQFFKEAMELHTPSPVRYLMIYLIGFYILLISLRVNPWLSIGGAIAYAFSTYFIIIIGAGHLWKVNALAFIPPALAGILLTLQGKYILGGLLASFFLILELYSNHIQMTYYFLITVLCIVGFEFYYRLKQKELKQFFTAIGVLAIASILAVGVNSSNLFNSYEYGKQTIRGKSELTLGNKDNKTNGLDKDYATQWSYGVQETLTLLIPNAKGGAGSPQEATQLVSYLSGGQIENVAKYYDIEPIKDHHYWGNQPFTAGPVYVGAVILFLFFLGLIIVPGRFKWGLLTATILAIMLSWGHNFQFLTDLFLDYVPLYNKFRVVSSILVVVELCVPILAILAVKKVLDEPEILQKKVKLFSVKSNVLILPLLLTAGISLLLYLLPSQFMDFITKPETSYFAQIKSGNPNAVTYINQIESDIFNARVSIFRADALRTILFVGLIAVLLFGYSKKWFQANILIAGVVVLILVDLWPVNKRFLNADSFVPKKELKIAFNPTQADFEILQSEFSSRPELQPLAKKAQDEYKKENRRASKLELAIVPFTVLNQHSNYRVLNTSVQTWQNASTSFYHKSIGGYHGAKLRRYQELIDHHITKNNMKVINMLNTKYIITPDKEKGNQAQLNPDALGEAWIVPNYKIVANADEEIMALNTFDPAKEALVDKRFASQLQGFTSQADSLATIAMKTYAPNKITYQFNAKSDQLVVFSDIYYQPGWNAYIDGKLTPHFRANYILRAMKVPGGKHKIIFKFEPKAMTVTENISVASMVLFFLLLAGGIVFGIKNIRKETIENE
ncbi:YfhO family protein [Labilibaculum sp. A4]|uniref:YfhO family protein n=1 Tax=Labilibaculum euxinus TaxID=2686357 RepID=UPI000F61C7A6|nr:YfhO family protein [Labilibaculum euxinus]MDQ1771679.1 YfhO family protein [Labilibaculum euxinus]MWN77332.1 YfhO family protein [Labilibaculum euxinus]